MHTLAREEVAEDFTEGVDETADDLNNNNNNRNWSAVDHMNFIYLDHLKERDADRKRVNFIRDNMVGTYIVMCVSEILI